MLRIAGKHGVLNRLFTGAGNALAPVFAAVQTAQKEQVRNLPDHFERIGKAILREIEPQLIDFGAEFRSKNRE
jgi:hypothetical protein